MGKGNSKGKSQQSLGQVQPSSWSSLPRAHYWTACIGPNGTTTRAWATAPTPSSTMRTCCWGFRGCGSCGSAMTPAWCMRTSARTFWAATMSTPQTRKSNSPLGPSMAQREWVPQPVSQGLPLWAWCHPRFGNCFHSDLKSLGGTWWGGERHLSETHLWLETLVWVIEEQKRYVSRQSHSLQSCLHTQVPVTAARLWRQSCQRKHPFLPRRPFWVWRMDPHKSWLEKSDPWS